MAKKRKPSSRSSRSRTPSHPSARSSRSRTPSHPSSGARTSSLPSRERSGTGDQQHPTATQAEPAQQGGDAAQGRMAKKGEKQRTPTSRQSASRTPSHHSSGAHTTSVRSGERSGSADEQRSGTQAKAMPIFPELAMSMLRSVSPCDNFYQFVCGSWSSFRRRYMSVGQALYDSVSEAIQARANTHPPTTRTSATRKAFDMYRSCVHAHEVARIHDEESSLKRFMGEHRLVVSSKDYEIDTVDLLVDLAVNWHLPFLFHLAPHWDNATGEAMLRLVARAPWMDARSRELFKLKVLQQKRYIWMSYQATYTNVLDNLYFDFPDMTENFVANWISSSKVLARKLLLNTSMDYIGRTDPALVRYLYHQNAQLIPMSLVFKPMYVPDGTPAINYAGLGAVYSQLLMQLFDTVGVLFNHNNDFVSWMTAPTLASHRVILQCLFKEQPQVEVWERLAFELIYEAFIGQKLQKQEGLRLQGLEEFSDDAVFYMSYCYMSCARTASKGTPVRRAHVCNAIKTTNHFRETFKCPPISDKRERAESKCRPFWNLTYHT